VTHRASGTFDVKLVPQGEADAADGIALGQMSIDKHFHGELEAISKGAMLSARRENNGSAAYVAIERVTMSREQQALTVTVVPESGTGQLEGLSGTMTITIVEKKHLFELAYELP
jgi:hypothetical protein